MPIISNRTTQQQTEVPLTVTSTGTVEVVGARAVDLDLAGETGDVANHGRILSRGGAAVYAALTDASLMVENRGAMAGSERTVWVQTTPADGGASSVEILNLGRIVATVPDASAVVGAVAHNTPTNRGTIAGDVHLYGEEAVIRNDGVVRGAVDMNAAESHLSNDERIGGDLYVGDGLVENAGRIHGSVALGGYAGTLRNDGRIDFGIVSYASDGVTLDIGEAGRVEGTVRLSGGDDDVANAGRLALSVTLGAGADRYRATGKGYANSVDGGDGDDRLVGATRTDNFFGDAGDDSLLGGGGSDHLTAEDGDDVLRGGSGRDTLEGGAGTDLLIGGRGADVFFMQEGRTLVRDFTRADALDLSLYGLSGIDDPDLTIATTADRTLVAVGEDTIVLVGRIVLGADDFIF